jgi:predicted nucleic acid-binding protein
MILVDTNILLEVLLSRGRKEACKRLLGSLRDGDEEGLVTDFTVHSIMVIMDGMGRRRELRTFLLSLTAYKGLRIYQTSIVDEVRAVELTEKSKLDIDDAVQYSSAITAGVEAIASFDRHFEGLTIPRMEPS